MRVRLPPAHLRTKNGSSDPRATKKNRSGVGAGLTATSELGRQPQVSSTNIDHQNAEGPRHVSDYTSTAAAVTADFSINASGSNTNPGTSASGSSPNSGSSGVSILFVENATKVITPLEKMFGIAFVEMPYEFIPSTC